VQLLHLLIPALSCPSQRHPTGKRAGEYIEACQAMGRALGNQPSRALTLTRRSLTTHHLAFTMSDPVAEKSAFLRMYMSSHPDTLVAYAKHFGKVSETIESAEMIAISTKASVPSYTRMVSQRLTVKSHI